MWLRRVALVLASSSLAVACFLNPKTDDLPDPGGFPGGGVIIDVPGGNEDESPLPGGNSGVEAPNDSSGEPPLLGAPEAPPDAGAPADTLAADGGSQLADSVDPDAGRELADSSPDAGDTE